MFLISYVLFFKPLCYIEQCTTENEQPLKHLCHCLLANWNLDQNLGETYEYALKWKIHDTLSRLGSSENTFTQVYVYEPETIKLNTDHYFIEQYNRQRAPQKKISRCLLASWNLDQNLGRIRNRRRHCS